MGIKEFIPSRTGAVKIAVVVLAVLAVLTYVVPVMFAARLGLQPQNSKVRLVQ